VFLTLQELGLYRSTLVILVSDHGENLYEGPGTDGHPPAPPHYGHGHAYATVSRIPMVVRVPGDVEGSDWPQLVTLADIPSTAYAFTSVDPNDGLAGRDLLGSAVRVGDDWVLVQGADHGNSGWAEAVVWAGGSKWLVDGAGNEELFNLRDDPGERANLIPDQPELAATARAQFVAIKAGLKLAESTPVGLDALPPEVVERLRALGYVN
jgi:arylsulfatase A-like enzyme